MQKKNRARTKKVREKREGQKKTRFCKDSDVRAIVALERKHREINESLKLDASPPPRTCFDWKEKKLCFSLKVEFAFVQKKKEKKEQGESTKTKRISQKKDFEDFPRDRALKFLLKQVMLRVTLFHRKICDPLDSHDQVSLIDYASLGYSISTYSM